MRLILLLIGAGLVVLAFRVPVEVVEGGGRTLEGFWVGALGTAFVALGVGWVRGWKRSSALTAMLALCLAAQLTATHPSWLQYLKIELWRFEPLIDGEAGPLDSLLIGSLGVIALQVMAMARYAGTRRERIREILRAFASPVRIALLLAFFLAAAAHSTLAFDPVEHHLDVKNLVVVLMQYIAAAVIWATNLLHLAAIAEAMPERDLIAARRSLTHAVSLPGSDLPPTALDRALPWILAGFATVTSAALAFVVLDRVPHVPDGVAYLFQARCLAAGMVSTVVPAVPEAFQVYLIDSVDGRFFGVTNPGWPVLLSLGAFIGAEWLVNPVLGGVAVLFAHALVRRIADRGTANAVTLLLVASPWFLWISASFMTHATTLALVAGGWLAVRSERALPMLAGGLAIGLLCLVRPLEGVAVGTLTGLWLLGLGGRRAPFLLMPLYALGCLGGAALLLLYNQSLTGDPLAFPINDYLDRLWYPGANAIGFGPDKGNPPGWGPQDPLVGHGVWDVLYNTNQNVYHLNFELLGWASGSLLLLVVHVLRGRWDRTDRAALAFLVALVVIYNLYWFSGGSDYGARYWYLMILPLLWLSYRGLGTLGGFLEEHTSADATPRVMALAGISIGLTLFLFMPWRAVAKYADYRGYHGDFREIAAGPGMAGSLVLVEVGDETEYGLAFLENDPEWSSESPIFAWARDEETIERLIEAHPDRPIVRVAGRSSGKTEGRTLITSRRSP